MSYAEIRAYQGRISSLEREVAELKKTKNIKKSVGSVTTMSVAILMDQAIAAMILRTANGGDTCEQ